MKVRVTVETIKEMELDDTLFELGGEADGPRYSPYQFKIDNFIKLMGDNSPLVNEGSVTCIEDMNERIIAEW